MKAAQRNELRPLAHDEVQPGAVGRVLRDAREGFGQDIATVSQQLRIRSVYLKAIEEGRYQDLPGSTYAVGFVRSYAEYLGLEPNEIVRRFRDEAAEVNGRTKLNFPMPAVEARVPSGALVLMALMVAVLAYGGWYYLSDRDRSLVDLVPDVPASLQALVEPGSDEAADASENAPAVSLATADAASVMPTEDAETDAAATTAPSSSSNVASTPTILEAGATGGTTVTTVDGLDINVPALDAVDEFALPTPETGAASVATISDLGVPAEAPAATTDTTGAVAAEIASAASSAATALDAAATDVQTAGDLGAGTVDPTTQQLAVIPAAPSAPDSVQENQDFGVAFGGSRVVIVARMESFLRVRDADGNEIWSRLLRSGDRYLVPERDGLTLTVGNAGGVDVFVDGRKAPALGAVGVGMSGISLDPTRLAAGTALP
jgi:cytoskeleton protein RodZ